MASADDGSDPELLPIGTVEATAMEEVQQAIERTFDLELVRRDSMELPVAAFDAARGQYDAAALLPEINEVATEGPTVGVTGADLSAEGREEILGVNLLPGTTLVLSTNRLWTSDRELYRQRLRKEALHLVATMYMAEHCVGDPEGYEHCVHQYTPQVANLDQTPEAFCIACQQALADHLR